MPTPLSKPPGTWSEKLSATNKVGIVREIIDCFQHGDVSGILAQLDAQVSWVIAGNPAVLPFAGHYEGLEGIMDFFQTFGNAVEVRTLSADNYREAGNQVLVDTHFEGRSVQTGKAFQSHTGLVWTFNDQGKIIRLEQNGDLSAMEAMFVP